MSQAVFSIDVVRSLRYEYPYMPISVGAPWPSITGVADWARKSGLEVGDRVISIEGKVLERNMDLPRALHPLKPFQTLHVVVERDGRPVNLGVKLWIGRPLSGVPAFTSLLFMPWFCIALGFWVAAVRVHDSRAWMLLGILLGGTQLNAAAMLDALRWPDPIGITGHAYRYLIQYAWPISMMMFGLYFPNPGWIDRTTPWIKWILGSVLVVAGVWDTLHETSHALSHPGAWEIPPSPVPGWLITALMFVTTSVFFAAIGEKGFNPTLPIDDRRRLKLLYWGCTFAMVPSLLRFVYAWIFYHRNPHDDAIGVWTDAALATLPLILAYVVVVQRAMDVRMVIRQGIQYALARRGVVVLQLVVMAVIAYFALTYAQTHRLNYIEQSLLIAFGVAAIVQVREQADRVRRWVDRRFFREAYNAERILSELGDQVRTILDRDALLRTVARSISESLHVDRIAFMLRDGGMFRPALATGYPAPIETGIPTDAPAVSSLSESREPIAVNGLAPLDDAQLLLPLPSRKEILGFISLGPKKSEEPYSPSDTNLLRTVAAQTGLALENTRLSDAIAAEVAQRELLNREIEIAREVQQRLFPQTMPDIPRLQFAGHCRPARGVGGDYYDFLALASGRLGLAIADVSGKGIPAALLMASLQASVRGQSQTAAESSPNVAGLMANVNRLVCEASHSNRYATFFYGQFDPVSLKLVYANGGHNPPILLRESEVIRLEDGGPPVGLFPFSRYSQAEVQLETGDLLVLFTDGVSEAENPNEEEWGEDAVIETSRLCRALAPSEIISRLMEAADAFAAGAPQHDDMTLVIARVV